MAFLSPRSGHLKPIRALRLENVKRTPRDLKKAREVRAGLRSSRRGWKTR